MPKITAAGGPSNAAEENANVETQEPILAQPQERPGENIDVVDNDYSGWTGAQLTEELEKRGLPKSGTKSEQQRRLEEDDNKEENLVEEEEDEFAFLNKDDK